MFSLKGTQIVLERACDRKTIGSYLKLLIMIIVGRNSLRLLYQMLSQNARGKEEVIKLRIKLRYCQLTSLLPHRSCNLIF